MLALQNHKINFWNFRENFLWIFFSIKPFRKNPLCFAIFGPKFDKSSEPDQLNRRMKACNSLKWSKLNPDEIGKNLKFLTKNQKINCRPNKVKNDKKIENYQILFQKKIWSGIDLDSYFNINFSYVSCSNHRSDSLLHIFGKNCILSILAKIPVFSFGTGL